MRRFSEKARCQSEPLRERFEFGFSAPWRMMERLAINDRVEC